MAAPLLSVLCVVACAEPPNKEINQALGAIDAARAAGAERYAGDALQGAVDTLKRAEESVATGDYRQALSYAIDSRDRAQTAAKLASDGRAQAQSQAERSIAEVSGLRDRLAARLKAPEVARLPRRVLSDPQSALDAATKALQEARAAIANADYAAAVKALDGSLAGLEAALSSIDAAAARPGGTRKP